MRCKTEKLYRLVNMYASLKTACLHELARRSLESTIIGLEVAYLPFSKPLGRFSFFSSCMKMFFIIDCALATQRNLKF